MVEMKKKFKILFDNLKGKLGFKEHQVDMIESGHFIEMYFKQSHFNFCFLCRLVYSTDEGLPGKSIRRCPNCRNRTGVSLYFLNHAMIKAGAAARHVSEVKTVS